MIRIGRKFDEQTVIDSLCRMNEKRGGRGGPLARVGGLYSPGALHQRCVVQQWMTRPLCVFVSGQGAVQGATDSQYVPRLHGSDAGHLPAPGYAVFLPAAQRRHSTAPAART